MKPLAIDLFCGLGGWTEGLLAEGWRVRGYDIEAHDYGTGGYPGELVLQDVTTLHGSQFAEASLIVASPPCQAYSYRAMPWSRAKALPPPDNMLFDTCFRLQREACEAAGRHIPMVVGNVRGAQKWVGRAAWNYGSFYLWGDVPALMPQVRRGGKNMGGSWFAVANNTGSGHSRNPVNVPHAHAAHGLKLASESGRRTDKGKGARFTSRDCGLERLHANHHTAGIKQHGSGAEWYDQGIAALPSSSPRRKAASAMIAKIPEPLSRHIARVFKPAESE